LVKYEGAVGTFASKIVVAYAFKLVGPITRADLDLVRFLRNEFAHSRMPIDFNTSEVRVVCDEFKLVDFVSTGLPTPYLSLASDAALKGAIDKKNAKTRFITTCHTLCHRMLSVFHGQPFPDNNPLP